MPAFKERSGTANQGELSVEWDKLPNRAQVQVSAGYRASVADATDGDAILGDDGDVSYHGFLAGLSGRTELSRKGPWRFGGDLGIDLATRTYDSDLPVVADPFHAGRSDMLFGVEAGLRAEYRHWDARAFFRVENNTADLGTGASPTSDSGSYKMNQIGLALSWAGDVWKSGSK